MRILAACLALTACHRPPDVQNHDPRSPEITGLQRAGDGSYKPGTTEKFTLLYSVDEQAQIHWSSSGGPIVPPGDRGAWPPPGGDEAPLPPSIETKPRLST